MKTKAFMVCLDEIRQNFVFGEPVVGSYTRTVTMSDGSVRTISLTPMVHRPLGRHAFDHCVHLLAPLG
jgi:hypothetical protein